MISVTADTRDVKRKIRALMNGLRPSGRRRVLRKIGLSLRNEVRNRFTTQGNGTWAPLSAWTRARTGRRKALIGLRDRVKVRVENDKAEVYFDNPSEEWSIEMHNRGFKSSAVDDKRMVVPLANGASIGAKGSRIVFTQRRMSVIPARRIWLTAAETRAVLNRELDQFAQELERA